MLIKQIIKILFLITFCISFGVANEIKGQNLLFDSQIYLDLSKELEIDAILDKNLTQFNGDYFHKGFISANTWVKFTLKNNKSYDMDKLLEIKNPLIFSLKLYKIQHKTKLYPVAVLIKHQRKTLNASYSLTLPAHSEETFYLKVSMITTLKFGLNLYTKNSYYENDRKNQIVYIILLAVIFTMMIYNFLIFLFMKDKRYLYYSIYLFLIIWFEMSFIGLTPVFFSYDISMADNSFIVEKLNLLIIAYILYSVTFLELYKIPILYRLNYMFILAAIINLFVISIPYITRVMMSDLLAISFIIFIFISGLISYYKGHKHSRLFIVGFSVVLFSYLIILIDALGLVNFKHHFQSLIIIATSIESLILSIAFFDSYRLMQDEKLKNSLYRADLIEKEVLKKTDQLQRIATTQEFLFNELHHRVKNNLQLILSIVRLQRGQIKNPLQKENFKSLEQRINAIAQTHNTIYLSKELETVCMNEYITQLVDGLRASDLSNKITVTYNITANMGLKRAVNIGLITNELVSNALKHAFPQKYGELHLTLYDDYLEIYDNGIGCKLSEKEQTSLGLNIVKILVKDQLKGTLYMDTKNGTKFTIRYKSE